MEQQEKKCMQLRLQALKTGDNTNLLARWFALFAAAVVLAVTARKLYRKEKDR